MEIPELKSQTFKSDIIKEIGEQNRVVERRKLHMEKHVLKRSQVWKDPWEMIENTSSAVIDRHSAIAARVGISQCTLAAKRICKTVYLQQWNTSSTALV